MGLFDLFNNYDKPGPGVSKDEPQKAPPIRFFEIFWRKLSKLVQLNLIYMIPFAAAVVLMVLILSLPAQHLVFQSEIFGKLDIFMLYAVPAPLALIGPCNCGLAYVTRNFAREEHAFIWSDFWDAVKDNWKAGLLNSIIGYVAYVILSFSFMFYLNRALTESKLNYVPLVVIGLISVVMLFSQYYIPMMIVTFDLKLRHIYKNAAIFSVMGLLRNILITLVLAAAVIGVWFCSAKFIFIPFAIFVLIGCSFFSFLCSFAIYSIINGYLIEPYYRREAEAQGKPVIEEDTFAYEPDELDDDDEDAPKYVYVNGRLIEKSLLKEEVLFSDDLVEHSEDKE